MVDIGAAAQASGTTSRDGSVARTRSGIVVELRPADDAALAEYEAFCRAAAHAPAQDPLWVRSWIAATGADAVIVDVRRGGRTICTLALEIVREGPFRIARFPGGSHANGNFVATAPGEAEPLSAADRQALCAAIRQARPDIDLIYLERQNPHFDGLPNPLAGLATGRSPNISLATDLDGGFQATLERANAKRKRKKYRFQLRKFEGAGGHRVIIADTPEEVDRLLDAFFVMRAARFRKMGIAHNVFGSAQVQAFFRALFRDALEKTTPPFVLHGLEVGGELRGVNGLSITAHSMVCEFVGIRDDDPQLSPGFFLDYACMEEACQQGKKLYDFSVGDDPAKRSWCDVETWQFDTLMPLTARGLLFRTYVEGRARAVRFVKSNRLLWTLVRHVRRRKNDGSQEAAGD